MIKIKNALLILLITFAYLPHALAHNDHARRSRLKSDNYYMNLAIQAAKANPEYPFGAVIVDHKNGKILASGVNNSKHNPTLHGEMVAINNCAETYPNLNWSRVTLYTTAEPCSMCQSAVIWAKIPRVVYGTSIDYLISHGWEQINIQSSAVNKQAPFYKGTITAGLLADKTDPLFNKKP